MSIAVTRLAGIALAARFVRGAERKMSVHPKSRREARVRSKTNTGSLFSNILLTVSVFPQVNFFHPHKMLDNFFTQRIPKGDSALKLTVNKETALFLLRKIRAQSPRSTEKAHSRKSTCDCAFENGAHPLSTISGESARNRASRTSVCNLHASPMNTFGFSSAHRCNLEPADPAPQKRWTKRTLDLSVFGIDPTVVPPLPLAVCVPRQGNRAASAYARCTVYENELPPDSFIDLGSGLAMSSPELLFVELSGCMTPIEHLALGYELCGTYVRDAANPLGGPVSYGVEPVTSVAKIRRFVHAAHNMKGLVNARRSLLYLADNAWSPTESVIASVIALPLEEYGYGLGPCILNARIDTPEHLMRAAAKRSRVPDLLIAGTHVGINYDGAVHLDLDSIVRAACEVERNPGYSSSEAALNAAVRGVRAKVVDDIRRNRELAAAGFTVFPVVKEDLYESGGFDRVMTQVVDALAHESNRDVKHIQEALTMGFASKERQRMLLSVLPGRGPRDLADFTSTEAFVSF